MPLWSHEHLGHKILRWLVAFVWPEIVVAYNYQPLKCQSYTLELVTDDIILSVFTYQIRCDHLMIDVGK